MPRNIAPYQVMVLAMNVKDEESWQKAVEIHDALNQAGIDTLLDDRDERAGVKFKDADLIGCPLRIVIGPKTMKRNAMETKLRCNGEMADVSFEGDWIQAIRDILDKAL